MKHRDYIDGLARKALNIRIAYGAETIDTIAREVINEPDPDEKTVAEVTRRIRYLLRKEFTP